MSDVQMFGLVVSGVMFLALLFFFGVDKKKDKKSNK